MYTYKIFDTVTKEFEDIFNSKNVKFDLTFFQHIEYIKEITKDNKSNLRIIVIYHDNLILTILPFEIKKYVFIKVLQWIGTKYSDYCNPILSKKIKSKINRKHFLATWNLILKDIKNDFDLIFLNNQLALINEQPNPFVNYFSTYEFSKIYSINFENDFNDYKEKIKNKNKKHAYEIHRTIIKYEKLKETSKNLKTVIQNSDHNLIDFNKIAEEKKEQLQKKKINNKLDHNFIRLFKNLIQLKKFKFYVISLNLEDKTLARCFGFVFDNTFYYYMPIVLPNSFGNYKPGKILILQIIKWCIKNNITKFDFGLGSEKYKKYFSNNEISLHRYLKAFSFKGTIVYFFMLVIFKIKKLWP